MDYRNLVENCGLLRCPTKIKLAYPKSLVTENNFKILARRKMQHLFRVSQKSKTFPMMQPSKSYYILDSKKTFSGQKPEVCEGTFFETEIEFETISLSKPEIEARPRRGFFPHSSVILRKKRGIPRIFNLFRDRYQG